jgi:integrase
VATLLSDIEPLSWHDLRRTCGCRLLQDYQRSRGQVSKWLGHASISVTERNYAFLTVYDARRQLLTEVSGEEARPGILPDARRRWFGQRGSAR